MAEYMAIPNSTGDLTVVATGTGLKTVLQVLTPSTTSIGILAWGVSFDGTSAGATPGKVVLIHNSAAATVTSLTPEVWGNNEQPASLCVGGTAATGYNASAEGTVASSTVIDGQHVHPQSGYEVWFPADHIPRVQPSRSLRIRCTFAAAVNVIPWIIWREPSM